MTRKFREKRQNLIKLKVCSANDVSDKSNLTKIGTPILRSGLEIYGQVEKPLVYVYQNSSED